MVKTTTRAGEICFETSGSTGPPRRWFRLCHQMEQEVELIGGHLVGPVDQVINYAPPRHLFGALFGQWFPRLADVRVHQAWADPFEFPAVSRGSRVLVVCVPMAWELLRRNWRFLEHARSVVALHSAAAPPGAAYEFVHRRSSLLRAHEILGSTEAGGIAHRPLGPKNNRPPWRAFPDVAFVRGDDARAGQAEELVVRSPRLARPEGAAAPPPAWPTGDLVEFVDSGVFRLVGRSSSLIKVNGSKVHLSEVDELLSERLPGADFVSLPLPGDSLAGEGYVIFWSPRRDHQVGLSNIRSVLRSFPSPSRIVELTNIPRTVTGKPDKNMLIEAL